MNMMAVAVANVNLQASVFYSAMRIYSLLLFIAVCCITPAYAGKKLHVLFIGNSYTYVNNMPGIVADIASSMGDTLIWEMEAQGGFTLGAHFVSPMSTAKAKIAAGGWDYVVLQEQSQVPALPDALVHDNLFV